MNVLKYIKMARNSSIAFVALTTRCNCKCPSCDMWKDNEMMNTAELADYGFERLIGSGFGMLELTGGEPLILNDIGHVIEKAKEHGLFVQLMTNGTITSDKKIDEVVNSGADLVCVSVDCHDNSRASKHRMVSNINEKIKETVKKFHGRGMLLSSTTLLTKKNHYDIEKTVEFVNNELGMYFSCCPPDFSENYKLGSKKDSIAISNGQLIETFRRILELKRNGYKILNTKVYMRDAIRWLSGEKPRYSCMAGKNMIYVDWNMKVYPCFIKESICSLSELTRKKLGKIDCNRCCFQCFREPSIFYHARGKLEFKRDAKTLAAAVSKSGFFK